MRIASYVALSFMLVMGMISIWLSLYDQHTSRVDSPPPPPINKRTSILFCFPSIFMIQPSNSIHAYKAIEFHTVFGVYEFIISRKWYMHRKYPSVRLEWWWLYHGMETTDTSQDLKKFDVRSSYEIKSALLIITFIKNKLYWRYT